MRCWINAETNSAPSSAYTSAMFSETRYAMNGDLRVAYRRSREGPRDIVLVASWFTCCEILPELPPGGVSSKNARALRATACHASRSKMFQANDVSDYVNDIVNQSKGRPPNHPKRTQPEGL